MNNFANISNRLLRALPLEDLHLLIPDLEPVKLAIHQPLEVAGQRTRYIYFIESGMASVVASAAGRHRTEVGMIGFEGATGSAIVLGDEVPAFDTFAQIAGSGLRMPSDIFAKAVDERKTLRTLMLRYIKTLWIQASYTAMANVHAKLEARLARWLLMMHDRVASDQIDITHEFLAMMLSARRPGVTVALHVLEGEHLIKCTRGHVVIRDRVGLVAIADGTYSLPEDEYDRLIEDRVAEYAE